MVAWRINSSCNCNQPPDPDGRLRLFHGVEIQQTNAVDKGARRRRAASGRPFHVRRRTRVETDEHLLARERPQKHPVEHRLGHDPVALFDHVQWIIFGHHPGGPVEQSDHAVPTLQALLLGVKSQLPVAPRLLGRRRVGHQVPRSRPRHAFAHSVGESVVNLYIIDEVVETNPTG
ncbi:hypothetical protein T01_7911 [Trichinella spiralis]|uniref:Uncharacterized protein n=1 Tax=Trichinella spiralis TaxID=6334 RepID=A0A0V1B0A1_TRISP|nr:hypothetical protein T01_7911 [Trichinella spiralis]